MKRKLMLVAIAMITAFLLIPRVYGIDDGGSMFFQAPLYSATKYHALDSGNEGEYLKGWSVEILGMEIYYHVE